jgi:hypothetical protein
VVAHSAGTSGMKPGPRFAIGSRRVLIFANFLPTTRLLDPMDMGPMQHLQGKVAIAFVPKQLKKAWKASALPLSYTRAPCWRDVGKIAHPGEPARAKRVSLRFCYG